MIIIINFRSSFYKVIEKMSELITDDDGLQAVIEKLIRINKNILTEENQWDKLRLSQEIVNEAHKNNKFEKECK